MKLIEGSFDNPEVNNLLEKHFKELRSVSPEGSAHVLDIPGLKVNSIKFWSLWENNNLVGCGALKFLDIDHGEFKSIRVIDEYRKKGYGNRILKRILKELKYTNDDIYLHAQLQVVNFYKKQCFIEIVDVFFEAGLKHYKMVLD